MWSLTFRSFKTVRVWLSAVRSAASQTTLWGGPRAEFPTRDERFRGSITRPHLLAKLFYCRLQNKDLGGFDSNKKSFGNALQLCAELQWKPVHYRPFLTESPEEWSPLDPLDIQYLYVLYEVRKMHNHAATNIRKKWRFTVFPAEALMFHRE